MTAVDPAGAETYDELTFETDGRSVTFRLDESVYALDAIYGTAYLFVDRCFVFLSRPGDGLLDVRLRLREPAERERLVAMAGEFANELLNQVLRFRISDSTGRIREYYMARAFLSTPAQASIDQLLAELDAEEHAEEPLDIAVPWEGSGRA